MRRELAEWRIRGLTLPIWWRDDDVIEPTKNLERLLELSRKVELPLHLAVIPARVSHTLVDYLQSVAEIRVLVHGWCHRNHSPVNERPAEFGIMRQNSGEEIRQGLSMLSALFRETTLPIFVPPWNRITPEVFPILVQSGYRGLSCHGPRINKEACKGLQQTNTHIDLIDWNCNPKLLDPEVLIAHLVKNLVHRRTGKTDATEPLGLLTHHLVHEDSIWAFCSSLLEELRAGPTSIYSYVETKSSR